MNWLDQHVADLDAWEVAAKAAIKALAEHHRRALGQLFRHAANRLKGRA